jgi:hypothetical protein
MAAKRTQEQCMRVHFPARQFATGFTFFECQRPDIRTGCWVWSAHSLVD